MSPILYGIYQPEVPLSASPMLGRLAVSQHAVPAAAGGGLMAVMHQLNHMMLSEEAILYALLAPQASKGGWT